MSQGIIKYGMDWDKIRKEVFHNNKAEVEIELRACILLGVKESKNIGDKELNDFKKSLAPKPSNGKAVKNGKKHSKWF